MQNSSFLSEEIGRNSIAETKGFAEITFIGETAAESDFLHIARLQLKHPCGIAQPHLPQIASGGDPLHGGKHTGEMTAAVTCRICDVIDRDSLRVMIHAEFDGIQNKPRFRCGKAQDLDLLVKRHHKRVRQLGGMICTAHLFILCRGNDIKRPFNGFRTFQREFHHRSETPGNLLPDPKNLRAAETQIDELPLWRILRQTISVVLRNQQAHGISGMDPEEASFERQLPLPFQGILPDAVGMFPAFKSVVIVQNRMPARFDPASGEHRMQMRFRMREIQSGTEDLVRRRERHSPPQNPVGRSTNAQGMPNFSSTSSFTARTPGISLR